MRSNLPSIKLFYFFIPIIVGLAIFVGFRDSWQTGDSYQQNPQTLSAEVTPNYSNQIPGTNNASITQDENAGSSTPLTLTDTVTASLLNDYMTLSQSGAVSSSSLSDIAANAATNALSSNASVQVDVYTQKDMKILPGTTSTFALMTYANNLMSVSRQLTTQQTLINNMNTAINGGIDINSSQFAQMALNISKLYSAIAESLLVIPTPPEVADLHLSLINNYAKTAVAFSTLGSVSNDPVAATLAVKNIEDNETERTSIAQGLSDYMDSHGLTFSSETGTYIAP